MNRIFKSVVSLVMALVLVLSLCACGGGNDNGSGKKTETLTLDNVNSYLDVELLLVLLDVNNGPLTVQFEE